MKVILEVKVKPGAKNTSFIVEDNIVVARIAAPPVDGEANAALVKGLSKILKVSSANIRVKSGLASKNKLIEIESNYTKEQMLEKVNK